MAQKKAAEAEQLKQQTRELGDRIGLLDAQVASVDRARAEIMLRIPNLPHESVPLGRSAEDNPVVRVWREARFWFQAQISC
jgi:seryl-tRNA synthetase